MYILMAELIFKNLCSLLFLKHNLILIFGHLFLSCCLHVSMYIHHVFGKENFLGKWLGWHKNRDTGVDSVLKNNLILDFGYLFLSCCSHLFLSCCSHVSVLLPSWKIKGKAMYVTILECMTDGSSYCCRRCQTRSQDIESFSRP